MSLDPVDFLQQLVTIPSVSGREQAATAFLIERMAEMGMDARIDGAGNAVGVRDCPDGRGQVRRDVVLLGHVDTVPGEIPVRREEGRLYGRGTVDAKGPLAAFVFAAARAAPRPGTRLVVIGAVEEETASSRGAQHVVNGYRPATCIVGEPSGWNAMTIGYKGSLVLEYRLEQPMGHTAGPEPCVSEQAVAWWNCLVSVADVFNEGRERLFEQLLPSLRHIASESDGLRDRVAMTVGLRLPPAFECERFLEQLRAFAGDAIVSVSGCQPAFRTERNTHLVRAFNHALRARGQRPRHVLKTGTSDMNVVGPRWRCPIVAYGPGDSRLDHAPEEHVVVEEYLQAIDVLVEVLAQL